MYPFLVARVRHPDVTIKVFSEKRLNFNYIRCKGPRDNSKPLGEGVRVVTRRRGRSRKKTKKYIKGVRVQVVYST